MTSWIPILLLALAGFFGGGVYSTIRAKAWIPAIVCVICLILCLWGAVLWW